MLTYDFPEDVNSFKLLEIGQPNKISLRVVIAEAISRDEVDEIHGGLKMRVSPITAGRDSRVFEFLWSDYVSYSVTLESYYAGETEEPVMQRGIFLEFSQSRYLSNLGATELVEAIRRKTLRHWLLATLNHIVDVASCEPPTVRQLKAYELPNYDNDGLRH